MLEQIITEQDVRQLIHKHELYQEKENPDFIDFNEIIKRIYENISSPNFSFNINKTYLYDKSLYISGNLETKIVLRYLDKLIKRVYKVKQANRDRIIKQLISILQSTNDFYIIKLDISSFYESIDTAELIKRLKNDGIISFQNVSGRICCSCNVWNGSYTRKSRNYKNAYDNKSSSLCSSTKRKTV